jgi:hypothetical protein
MKTKMALLSALLVLGANLSLLNPAQAQAFWAANAYNAPAYAYTAAPVPLYMRPPAPPAVAAHIQECINHLRVAMNLTNNPTVIQTATDQIFRLERLENHWDGHSVPNWY